VARQQQTTRLTPLRPISRQTTFQKLRSLACFPEVHDLLVLGWNVSAVADVIRHQHGEYRHVQRRSLVEILRRYRNSLSDDVQLKLDQASVAGAISS